MYLFGAAIPELLYSEVPQLGASDNGILTDDDAVGLDYLLDWDKFHLRDKVSRFLRGRCIASAVAGRVFDKGASEGLAGLHRVSESVSDA